MKTEKCKNCMHYTAYYKQWASSFGRLNNGFCSRHQKPQAQLEACEDFKSNEQKEKRRDELRLKHLEQALESINEIAQILKEKFKD
jgi:hypothetical protein